MKLTDDSLMTFGKHRGEKMSEVPASYLHYLWSNGMENEKGDVADYIRENLDALKMETPDKIW